MKKNLSQTALAVVVCSSLLFTACNKKDNEAQPQPEETAVQDNNTGFNESEDLVSVSEVVLDNSDRSSNMRTSAEQTTFTGLNGATITITPKGTNATGRVVIDFGQEINYQGKTRKGKVIITYTDVYRVSGAVRTITFDNYYVNDTKITGSKTITFTNNVSRESAVFSASIVSDIIFTTKDSKTFTWASTRTRTYDTKGTLSNRNDDELTLTGRASGITRNNIAFTALITTPLLIKASCVSTSGVLPSSGVLEISPATAGTFVTRVVNYGSGSCDRMVNVTVGSQSFDVTVR